MQFTTLSLLATGARAATVLVTNNAMLGGGKEGWNTTVWAVDTTTGSSQLIADTFDRRPAQTGVVCNNVYYSVWADVAVGFGLRALDLASGESSDLATSSLFHVLACDPKDESKLLGTASDFTSMQGTVGAGDAPFHLKSYDPVTQTEAVVGTFPAKEVKWGGYDGIFSFTQDGSEVWAAWPRDECPGCPNSKKGGHVHIMDTSSGEIKISSDIAFSGKKGTPYFLLPDAKRGVFITKGGDIELKWADLDVTDGRLKAKIGNTDASGLWDSSAPSQMCGSNVLAFSKGDVRLGASVLNEISPADGVVINAVNLLTTLDIEGQDQTDIKALACVEPSTQDFTLV